MREAIWTGPPRRAITSPLLLPPPHHGVLSVSQFNGASRDWGRVGPAVRCARKISLLLGDKFGKSLRTVDEAKAGIEAAGFINVVEHRWKLPVGGWAADKRFKEIGQYNRIHWEQGIEGWSLYLLTTVLHWSIEEVQVYLAKVRAALKDRHIHAYQEM